MVYNSLELMQMQTQPPNLPPSLRIPLALVNDGGHSPHGPPGLPLRPWSPWGRVPQPSRLPKSAHTLCPPPEPLPDSCPQRPPAPALRPEPSHLPRARAPHAAHALGRLGAGTRDPDPESKETAAVLTRTGQAPQRRPQCPSRGARIAPRSSPRQPPPPLLRTHNKQCGARAGSANRLNRRLNRRPPGMARRAGAGPAAAYPRRRAPPASAPRSRSAAAATSSARVSGSSAQRRRLRRLLPWWRSRIRDRLRRRPRRRRRRPRDDAEHTHWPSGGGGPAAAGERKARPLALRAPPCTRALPHLRAPASARRRRRRLRQLRTWERAGRSDPRPPPAPARPLT
ncbi:uncharacterized protein LOC121828560 [Peromyscus maniculatus bairdii]|uniref:uncharacterized protein LOC121828560 n=1 Tax=Peromyscus maniculatus bairdii TaxID=230844 RepID=UPI003FD18A4F